MSTEDGSRLVNTVQYTRILLELGFSWVAYVPFTGHSGQRQEKLYLYYHWRKGALLVFDTREGGEYCVPGRLYFSWRPNTLGAPCECISFGTFNGDVLAGSAENFSSLSEVMAELQANGTFVTPWLVQPERFSLLHYMEQVRCHDSVATITQDRFKSVVSEDIRQAMAGK